MSDAEIEQAIRDAEQYAAQDAVRREALQISNTANGLIFKAEQALSKAGKQIEKEEKKQVKSDISDLRKLLSKSKPDKMTGEQLHDIQTAISRLEASSAHVIGLADMPKDEHHGSETQEASKTSDFE